MDMAWSSRTGSALKTFRPRPRWYVNAAGNTPSLVMASICISWFDVTCLYASIAVTRSAGICNVGAIRAVMDVRLLRIVADAVRPQVE